MRFERLPSAATVTDSDSAFNIELLFSAFSNVMRHLELPIRRELTLPSDRLDELKTSDPAVELEPHMDDHIKLFKKREDSPAMLDLARKYQSALTYYLCDQAWVREVKDTKIIFKITAILDFYVFRCSTAITFETAQMKLWSGLGFLFQDKMEAAAYNSYVAYSDLQRLQFNRGSIEQCIARMFFGLTHHSSYFRPAFVVGTEPKPPVLIPESITKEMLTCRVLLKDAPESFARRYLEETISAYLSEAAESRDTPASESAASAATTEKRDDSRSAGGRAP